MRKRILGSLPIAIALMSIPFVAKGEGPGYMVVVDKEGQQYETAIPDVAKVDFDTFSFTVQTKSGDRTTYDYEKTARINLAASSGISLQEMMVPVIQFKSKYKSKNKDFTERELAKIQLLSENHKISNLGFSLDFYQPVPVGDKILPAVYRIFMMDEDGNTVSDIKEVIADKDSPNNIDRKYHVSFNLKPGQYDRKKDYKLVISNGTDIPVEENFTIDIALADDFGFDL
jgi:hypothetical protein